MSFDSNLGLDLSKKTPSEQRAARKFFAWTHPTAGVPIAWGAEGVDGDLTELDQMVAHQVPVRPPVTGYEGLPVFRDIAPGVEQWLKDRDPDFGVGLRVQSLAADAQKLADKIRQFGNDNDFTRNALFDLANAVLYAADGMTSPDSE